MKVGDYYYRGQTPNSFQYVMILEILNTELLVFEFIRDKEYRITKEEFKRFRYKKLQLDHCLKVITDSISILEEQLKETSAQFEFLLKLKK